MYINPKWERMFGEKKSKKPYVLLIIFLIIGVSVAAYHYYPDSINANLQEFTNMLDKSFQKAGGNLTENKAANPTEPSDEKIAVCEQNAIEQVENTKADLEKDEGAPKIIDYSILQSGYEMGNLILSVYNEYVSSRVELGEITEGDGQNMIDSAETTYSSVEFGEDYVTYAIADIEADDGRQTKSISTLFICDLDGNILPLDAGA